MFNQSEFEELPSAICEDAEDFLEFIHEKIEIAVYFWTLWTKTFAEEVDKAVMKEMLKEIVGTEFEHLHEKLVLMMDDSEPHAKIYGFIRRFSAQNKTDCTDSPAETQ